MNIQNSLTRPGAASPGTTERQPRPEAAWEPMLANPSDSTPTLPVTAPFDDSVIGHAPVGSQRDIERALQCAHDRFRDKAGWIPLDERIGILERSARMMSRDHADLALLVCLESGKPMPDSLVEVTRSIDIVRQAINELRSHAGEVVPMGTTGNSRDRIALSLHAPIGVAVAISDFSHPLALVVQQVAAAVAAGCPVLVNPSEKTPLSCLRLVDILWKSGLPREWAQAIVTGDSGLREQLATDRRVDFVSFIGKSGTGWALRSKLGPGTRCALQHGGAAPVVVAPDADRARAIKAIAQGGYYHAGQSRVSVQRVYVPVAQARQFAAELAQEACRLRIGDPRNDTTQVGPLIAPGEVDRVHRWVAEAVAGGAECLCGGARPGNNLYACTVLLDPPLEAKVSRMEILGPVICVYGYETIERAFDMANNLPFALQAAVFTHDIALAVRAHTLLDASAVIVNDHTAFHTEAMPFSGVRESGLGVGGVRYALRNMQIQKTLVINHSRR